MFIKKAALTNFGQVARAVFDFTTGITVFTGENGSGKSTFLKAMSMIHYNSYTLTLKDYIKWGTSGFSIESEFEHLGQNYVSSMSYTEKGVSSRSLTCVETSEEYSNSGVVEFLAKLLDLNRVIAATIAFEGETDLITTSPAARRDYLKGIYDLSFKDQLAVITAQRDDVKHNLVRVEAEQTSLENQTFELHDLVRPPFSEAMKDKYTVKKNDLETEITGLRDSIKANDARIDESVQIECDLTLLAKKADTLEKELIPLKDTIDKKQKEVDLLTVTEVDTTSITEKYSGLTADLTQQLEQLKVDISEAKATLANLETTTVEYEKRIPNDTELDSRRQLIFSKKALAVQFQERMTNLESGFCPTCGHTIPPEEVSGLNTYINELLNEVDRLQTLLDGDYADIDRLKKHRPKVVTAERVLQSLEVKKSTVALALSGLSEKWIVEETTLKDKHQVDIDHRLEMLKAYTDNLITKESQLKSFRSDYLVLSVKYDQVKALIDPDSVTAYGTLVTAKLGEVSIINDKLMSYEDITRKNLLWDEDNTLITKRKKQRDEALVLLKSEYEVLSAEQSTLDLSFKILSREFPSFVISRMVSELEQYANEFLSRVYPAYQIHIKESKDALKIYYGEYETDVRGASGFEKQIFSFSYKYALGRIQNYGVLFLDEIDSAADIDNSKKLYDTLGKMDSCFKQVFVISHKPDTQEMLKNDYQAVVYHVEKGEYTQV